MNDPRPSVWMLSPWFPPRQRVGALRAWRFATNLPDHGWTPSVTCLATGAATLSAEERHAARHVDVRVLPTALDFTTGGKSASDLSSTSRSARQEPHPDGVSHDLWARLRSAVDRRFPVDTWLPLLGLHGPSMLAHLRRTGASVVWSTGNPWSAHVAAAALAARAGLPWVADYRDPWTLDPQWRANRHPATLALDDAIERRLLARATRVVFTSWTTAHHYRDHFRLPESRVDVIPNSYGIELERGGFERSVRTALRRPSPEHPWRLLFFGRFRPTSPATTWVAGLARLEALSEGASRLIRVESVGGRDEPSQNLAARCGVADSFVSVPGVPYNAAGQRLQQADALILSLGTARTDVIPAKLWDYVAAGVPILAPVDNPDVVRVIAETGTGYVPPMDAEGLANWLQALLRHAGEEGESAWPAPFAPSFDSIERYSASATTAALSQCLRQAVTSAAPPC